MRAIIYERYGSPEVLKLATMPTPVPKDHEVLVKVKASSLNMADIYITTGKPRITRAMTNGFFKPKRKIAGTDFSGIVESVGKTVTGFKPGDKVFGEMSAYGYGALGEYLCVAADRLGTMPEYLSFEEAACLPIAGCTALFSVRDQITIKPGDSVLVNGASGGVGLYVVQMLKSYGATVTGTCSKEKAHLVKASGADQVIDYKSVDFFKSGKQYDVIIDTALYHKIKEYRNVLRENGVHLIIGGDIGLLLKGILFSPLRSKKNGRKVIFVNSPVRSKDLNDLADLVKGGIINPKIDKTFKLEDSAEAFAYFASKKACGKVVITI